MKQMSVSIAVAVLAALLLALGGAAGSGEEKHASIMVAERMFGVAHAG